MTDTAWNVLRSEIYLRDKGICAACKVFTPLHRYELGHLLDAGSGGKAIPENLVVMCYTCNQHKPLHETIEEARIWLDSGETQQWTKHRGRPRKAAPNTGCVFFDGSKGSWFFQSQVNKSRFRRMFPNKTAAENFHRLWNEYREAGELDSFLASLRGATRERRGEQPAAYSAYPSLRSVL